MHVVDESTCFRLFGYAIHKEIDAAQCDDDKKKVNILKELVLPHTMKSILPGHLQHLDCGGLTFVNPQLLPLAKAAVEHIQGHLTLQHFNKYGKQFSSVSQIHSTM